MSLLKSLLSEDLKDLLAHEMASYVAYGMAFLVFLRLIFVRYNLISGIVDWYRRSALSGFDIAIAQNADLHGKYAVVTGACRTIGFETALVLCSRGCHVVLACQFLQDAERAAERIKKRYPTAKCVPMQLDLLSLSSVRRFAEEYLSHEWKLHYLVLNAGVWHWRQKTTEDGWNGVVQTNYLSHWYLTKLLVPRLIESAPSRVLIVSSWQFMFNYFSNCDENTRFNADIFRMTNFTPSYAYSCSKVCNALFAKELNSLLHDRGVTAYSIHPGWVRTEIWSQVAFCGWLFKFGTYVLCPFSKNASQGAATTLYCALTRSLETQGGNHFEDCRETKMDSWFESAELRKNLWKATEKCLNADFNTTQEKKHSVHIKARKAIVAN